MKRTGAVMAGLMYLAQAHPCWSEIGFDAGASLDAKEFLAQAKASKAPAAPRMILAGYVRGNDPQLGKPGVPVEWVSIGGGKFTMGTDNGYSDAKPIHEVDIKTFEMSKTLVTVEQYGECVIKGQCKEPATGGNCNWGKTGRQFHPVNCVNWEQANQYAKFKGARLPSESEWEYAWTGGKNQKCTWGNRDATCDEVAMYGNNGYSCASRGTLPVCSKPAGNTAQGLCDMAANVWQWVQDKYQSSYPGGAPPDGSAFEASGSVRAIRGGSFRGDVSRLLPADDRSGDDPGPRGVFIGFRLARSSR